MNADPWQTPQGDRALQNLLTIVSTHGSAAQRAVAKDVLEGRHTLTDLLYLPDPNRELFAGAFTLAEQWEKMGPEAQEEAMQHANEIEQEIIDGLAELNIKELPEKHPMETDDAAIAAEDDGDNRDISFIRDDGW